MNGFTFKIKKSLMISLVSDNARYTIAGTAANHVKMKLNGSGSCKIVVNDYEYILQTIKDWPREVFYLEQVCNFKTGKVVKEEKSEEQFKKTATLNKQTKK